MLEHFQNEMQILGSTTQLKEDKHFTKHNHTLWPKEFFDFYNKKRQKVQVHAIKPIMQNISQLPFSE